MKHSLIIVPEEFLNELKNKQEKIITLLEGKKTDKIPQYITEKEAQALFNRKATWFWEMRRKGILPYSRIGKSIYYSIADLERLFEKGKPSESI